MKLVILDRDGTINHDSVDFIKSPNEWRPIEGSLEAIARLTQAGYRIRRIGYRIILTPGAGGRPRQRLGSTNVSHCCQA